MMLTVALIAVGAALGGVSRYLLSQTFNLSGGFPWGTFGVNVIGSLLIGVLSGMLGHWSGNTAAIRAFAIVGFCGGFTTFSTFSNEAFRMLEAGQWCLMALYVSGSVAAGLVAVTAGYMISR